MAWGRLALLQAAGEDDATLQQMAAVFGYEVLPDEEGDITQELAHPGFQVGTATSQQTVGVQVDTSLPRLPARFLRVNRIVRNSDEGHSQKPAYLNDPAMCLSSSATKGTYSFAQPRLLLPMSRLIPFLLNSLGQQKAGSQLDQRRLARQLAQGKAIHHLPRLPRQRWPQRLQVIADTSARLEPYWGDFAFIIGQLKKLLGEEAVDAIHFDEYRLGSGLPMCSRWPVQDNAGWHSWRIPPADVPVLVLGDLGVDDRQGSARIHWQRLARCLRSHPVPLLALSPTAHSPVNKSLCRQFRPNPLNDVYGLPRHPAGNGFVLDGVAGGNLDDILALLSPLPLVDAGLLRRLRDGLEWGGSELESAIWNHPDMRQTGLGIRLREQVAEHYRQQYQQHFAGTPQAERLWKIVQEHHAPAHEGLRQLEKLNQCVLEKRDDHAALQDYLKRLCATVAQGGNSRLQRKALMMQCRTILASRPEGIWDSALGDRAYDLYALAYEDEIRAGQWPNMLEHGFNPARVQWVLGSKEQNQSVQWRLIQVGDQGQFKLQRRDSGSLVYLPVAEIVATRQFPPLVYQQPNNDEAVVVRDGAVFHIPDGTTIDLQSEVFRIELEAITKPKWASKIWRDVDGLSASIPWLQQEHTVCWKVSSSIEKSYWDWKTPFGEDEFGLYLDLNVKNITQRFRWIEPGTFPMGSPSDEAGSEPHESLKGAETQHQVTLTQGFWLADTAVTQSLWQAVVGSNPSNFNDNPNNPVEQVSWNDVQIFIKKLNGIVPGLQAQLPNEAQWKYACGTEVPPQFSFDNVPEKVSSANSGYDIFFAYSSKDRERLMPLVNALEQQGWSVFWDHRSISVGENWARVINNAIRRSRCVLVVWSKYSVDSEWVLEDASIGKQRNVLCPVRIDKVDIPIGFSLRSILDISDWNGDVNHPAFIGLTRELQRFLGNDLIKLRKKTVPVKSRPPNPWGLYGMPGNVWEWRRDWWQQVVVMRRVLRGGAWVDEKADRYGNTPDYRSDNISFRLALSHSVEGVPQLEDSIAKQTRANSDDVDLHGQDALTSGGRIGRFFRELTGSFRKKK